MKKMILAVSVLVVAVLTLGPVTSALAAGPSQGGPGKGNTEGRGFMQDENRQDFPWREGVPENRNLFLNREINLDGQLDDLIHEELALALELSPSELIDRIDNGESILDIAFSMGLDSEATEELMADVRLVALSEAVELGLISQEQSDWLASRGFGNPSLEMGMDCRAE